MIIGSGLPAIRDMLLLQKNELDLGLRQRYIKRDAKIKGISSDVIKVIIGPRRAGKSFFATHELLGSGSFGYVNFDDEALSEIKDYNEVVTEINSLYDKPKFLLFDEIQNLERWELFVNRMQRQGYNLIITGSNSNLLSKELATHLTGRHLTTNIFPLSFKEFISYDGREMSESEMRTRFSDYLERGGYPEPLVKGLDYNEYLSALFDSVIYKDIVKRYRIRKPKVVEELARYLISNSAKEFSYGNLAKMTNSDSDVTIKRYLGYLEEAFLFFEVGRYSAKVKEQVTSNKKIYCIDNGLIRAKAFRTGEDRGRLYENLAAIELMRRSSDGVLELYYWKNQQHEEVDFVVKMQGKITKLLQVCSDISRANTKNRETRALLKCSRELKCNDLTVLTSDYEAKEKIEWFGIRRDIKFVPMWKWLTA